MRCFHIQIRVMQPKFKPAGGTSSGSKTLLLSRQGAIIFELAPALPTPDGASNPSPPSSTYASRSPAYDWAQKATYFMSATEVVQLTALQANGEASE